ncbi:MAG: oligosaccharide flippase family protein [Sulfolobales archaeon]
MSESSRASRVVLGGLFLYLNNLVNISLGALFWIILGSVASVKDFGDALAIFSAASIVLGLLDLGLSASMVRFLGEYSEKDPFMKRSVLSTAMIMGLLLLPMGSLAIYLISVAFNINIFNLSREQIYATIYIILLGFSGYFSSYFLGIIDLIPLFIANFIGNILKIIVALILSLAGFGWVGILIGYSMIGLSILVVGVSRIVRENITLGINPDLAKKMLRAGISLWAPGLISLVASPSIGVVALYTTTGAFEAGAFYIANTVAGFSTALAGAVSAVALPHISSLQDPVARKTHLYRFARLGLALTIPVATSIIIFSSNILGLIKREYIVATDMLVILVFSNIIGYVAGILSNYLYASERYREVLEIGLLSSVIRVVLYIYLIPLLGGLGIAYTYLIVSIATLIITLKLTEADVGLGVLKETYKTFAPLTLLILVLFRRLLPDVLWLVEFAAILLISLLIETRLRNIRREDLFVIARSVLPSTLFRLLEPYSRTILGILFGRE